MEMQQVRYFLVLAETLNFTRAAEAANVSQPALTKAIKGLEAELGGPLFHRSQRGTQLTELGRLMSPYLQVIAAQATEARTRAKKFGRLDDVTLSIGLMCTIGPAIIGDFLAAFTAQHPNIELRIVDDSASALAQRLKGGEIELALFGLPKGLGDEFHVMPLFSERFMVMMRPSHRLADREAVSLHDLDGERYVGRANCEYDAFAEALLRDAGASLKTVFQSEREDWVQGMIAAGLGIGLFPELSERAKGVIGLPLSDPAMQRTINLVTLRGRPHSAAVGALVREARRFRWPGREPATQGLTSGSRGALEAVIPKMEITPKAA